MLLLFIPYQLFFPKITKYAIDCFFYFSSCFFFCGSCDISYIRGSLALVKAIQLLTQTTRCSVVLVLYLSAI